jgi:hypothetical protein
MYRIEDMTVKATPEEIIAAYEGTISAEDMFGEYGSCLGYLDYEHVKPYLKDGVTPEQWHQHGDEDLRSDFAHYRDWWREKIEDERGISVHRGKAQFAIRMMLAALPEWKHIWDMDGGWYQRDAYNAVAGLFEGIEAIK